MMYQIKIKIIAIIY